MLQSQPDLTEKLLVIVLAGKNDVDRARQGLVFAKNAKRLLSEVHVLFFGPGVQLLDPNEKDYSGLEALLGDLGRLNVGVSACVSNVHKYGLDERLDRKLVVAEEAASLISDHVKNGYQTISF